MTREVRVGQVLSNGRHWLIMPLYYTPGSWPDKHAWTCHIMSSHTNCYAGLTSVWAESELLDWIVVSDV